MISRPPTAFPIRRSPCCTDATCWRPPCCRAASATRAAPRPASSAPSASRSRPDVRSSARRPAQLAEVAKAAVELDGVKHMVMTTGTPRGADRGAAILCESAAAVKAAVDLPIQAQCEPPDDDAWFERLKAAGVDALGMHLEAVTPEVRRRIMPGKAEIPVERYLQAFAAAVPVFGRGQVSTYILAGLGDTPEAILAMCETLVALGVYPFVVPFVPISGTPLESWPRPRPPSCMRCSSRSPGCWSRQWAERGRHQGGLRQLRRLLGALDLREGGLRHDLRADHAVPSLRIPRQVRRLALGAGGRVRAAPAGVLRRAADCLRATTATAPTTTRSRSSLCR